MGASGGGAPGGEGTYAERLDWRRAWETVRSGEALGTIGRASLVVGYLSRRLVPGALAIRFPLGRRVYIRRRTFNSDFEAFRGVFLPRRNAYQGNYRGVAVLDIGAHKGYFGAYALLNGARRVVSYEPEPSNFALLERGARSFRQQGASWQARASAVAGRSGRAMLHVSGESWTHSLGRLPRDGAARQVGEVGVEVVGIAEALSDMAGYEPVVMKIDAEGSECDIVDALTAELVPGVRVVLIEAHDFADCSAGELSSAMARLGFSAHATVDPEVIRFER